MSFLDQYEKDLSQQTHSGPHKIDADRQLLNRNVFESLTDVLPFDDIHKQSDCDLIYRFLIAKKWDVSEAVKALREYSAFRKEHRLNEILWESVPEEMRTVLACDYSGFDLEGHPIFFDRPDPKGITTLLNKFTRDELMKTHFRMMEQGRRLCKEYKTDRVTCILDLTNLTMSVVANTAAIGFLKAMAHVDQSMYPENMRFMLICNGGWTFSALYKVLKPFLDPRVQQKINFIGSGANLLTDLDKFTTRDAVPLVLGGSNAGTPLLKDEDLRRVPAGTPPVVRNMEEHTVEVGSPMQDASRFPVPESDGIDADDL